MSEAELIQEMYNDVERRMLPFMKAKAARYRGVNLDDAIQEARLALMSAMTRFNYNRGDLQPYMREVVTNTYRAEVTKMLAASRCPRVSERGPDGEWTTRPQLPSSYEAMLEARVPIESEAPDATDAPTLDAETHRALRAFRNTLARRLNDRERAVLQCRIAPPVALIKAAGGEDNVDNVAIAEHLGMNKAQIDWALYKIRNVFTELAGQERFQELWGGQTRRKGWPRIHASKGTHRHNKFIARTLARRKLDDQQTGPATDEECAEGRRLVEVYSWGAIVIVEREGETWTLVCEGTFNPRAGEVTGASGARLLLPVEGYQRLAKALAPGAR